MGAIEGPLLLLVLGLMVLLAEAMLPSGGMLLVAAVVCLALGLWQAFRISFEVGLMFLTADVILTPLTVGAGLYLWQRSPLAAKMTLKAPARDEWTAATAEERVDHLVGLTAQVMTPLRPSGIVSCDGQRLDAVAEHGLIAPGTMVRILSARGGRVVVRPVESDDASPNQEARPAANPPQPHQERPTRGFE